jgi:hypothetical protein
MILVENIPGMGKREIKENCGRGKFKNDIFDIRTFLNATITPTQHNNKKQK